MMSMYVPSTSISSVDGQIDYEYQLIIQQLRALGITPSGDKNTDKAKLEAAKKAMAMMASQQTSSSKQSIPFEDIMNTLNLTVTGDLDKDYETTINELDYKIDLAASDDQKAYYQALKDQVEEEYNTSKRNSNDFTGANQVSAMNKMLLLGIY